MANVRKFPDPSVWASWVPFGIGEQRPNNYLEIVKALKENSDNLPYAWRILTQGCCDGCALGTTGLEDWTLDGVHLCNIRLRLLRLNTMPALDSTLLADAGQIAKMRSSELRDLGRLPYPMVRHRGERGFLRISWDEALNLIAARIRQTTPQRTAFYLTSRGVPNETYYVAQKAVRAMQINNIDNAARLCHAPSTSGLKSSVGVAATTCSYSDWLESELIVFIGSNMANNQPVATKYLHYAKKNGARIVGVNNYKEPGMERYWIPSIPESALFGTKIVDDWFLVNVGGDIAFLNGTIKWMLEEDWVDHNFIDNHTEGLAELKAVLATQSWEALEAQSGVSRAEMRTFAEMVRQARKAIFVWSMGITQHACGEDGVRAIVNLALTKGFVGRTGSGLMPIRGHSGVQGGSEMGAYATAFPGGEPITQQNAEALAAVWGFTPPTHPGMIAPEMIHASHRGDLDLLYSVGGNFLEVMPDPEYVEEALSRVPLRVHQDIVLSSQMFVEPADTVLLLPAATRYEIPGGVTQTSTERRVIFSPEIEGPRIAEARPEWEVFLDLARRVRPDLAGHLCFEDTAAIRREIAQVVPFYDGIQDLQQQGDHFQYGGPHLCADWKFPTADGKAHFSSVPLPRQEIPEGHVLVTTRRGKQFNSIVHERVDPLNGATREAVFLSEFDARKLGLHEGDPVILRNERGEYRGRAFISAMQPGNVQIHWPEGNVLLDKAARSPEAGIPVYMSTARLERG
jgi:molybdopterin-dependent oxidoreductase alpha subunit